MLLTILGMEIEKKKKELLVWCYFQDLKIIYW